MVPGDDGGCEWNPAAFSRGRSSSTTARGTSRRPQDPFGQQGVDSDAYRRPPPGLAVHQQVPGSHPFGLFGAMDTRTGKIAWKIEVPLPAKSGLTVAGDLVFFGESAGKFHAADAETGKILFTFDPRKSKIPTWAAPPLLRAPTSRAGGSSSPTPSAATCRPEQLQHRGPRSGKVGDAIIAFALPDKDDGEDDD